MDLAKMDAELFCEFRAGMDALRGMQLLFSMGRLIHIPLRHNNKYMFYPKSHIALTNSSSLHYASLSI